MHDTTSLMRRLVLGLGIATTVTLTGMATGVDARSYGPLDFMVVIDPIVREDDCGNQYQVPGTCAPRPDTNP